MHIDKVNSEIEPFVKRNYRLEGPAAIMLHRKISENEYIV